MALKTMIAAAIAALTMAFATIPSADAKTKVVIGIGNFGWGVQSCWGWPRRCGWHPRHNYYHYAPRHHYGKRVVYLGGGGGHAKVNRVSCARASGILARNGYGGVRVNDCRGSVYTFNARKNGKFHRVRVNAHNGHIIR
jgi:hypothetical protein